MSIKCLHLFLKTQKLHIFAAGIEVWCNGSTRDFGSLCPGSNPGISTAEWPSAHAGGHNLFILIQDCIKPEKSLG